MFTSGFTLREKIKSDFISARIFSKLKGVLIKGVKKEEDGQYSISTTVKEYATTPFSFFNRPIKHKSSEFEIVNTNISYSVSKSHHLTRSSNKKIYSYCSQMKPKNKGVRVFTGGATLRKLFNCEFASARFFMNKKHIHNKRIKAEQKEDNS